MESNIYIVDFTTDYFVQTLQKSLVQWNYGQTLRIQGLHLPSAVEIHFSLQETGGEAEVRIGVTKDGVTDVQIPDFVFENKGALRDYTAYAFIYPSDVYSGETIHKIILNVKARPKPKGFVTPSDEDLFHKTIETVNNAMNKTEGFSKLAESFTHGNTGVRPTEDTDNAKYYSEQANLDAQTTDADRQVVEQAKTEVLESAKEVGLNKQAVENVAKNVSDAETRIGNVENDIKLMQTDVQANKDAVDLAKTEITGIQTDVTTKAQQVESDRIKVEDAVADLTKPVREHNVSPTAHEDIRAEVSKKANKTEIPTKVSDLANDSGYLTQHQDISGKADKTEIPTKVSELTNDSGYLTEHQDISGKVDKVVQQKKDAEQDEAIKKNADDILTKVDKTEQEQKDLKQDEQINQNKSDILANAVKPEVVGNPLVLKDSSDNMALELEINGSTSQVQTTGKNLVDIFKFKTSYGVIDIVGSTVHVTNDKTYAIPYSMPIYLEAGIYNTRCEQLETSMSIYKNGVYYTNCVNDKNVEEKMVIKETGEYSIQGSLKEKSSITFSDFIITKELESTIPYEPYTGGKPSPSLEWEQPIVNGNVNNITWGNGADITFKESIPPIELSKWDKIKKIDGVWNKENCTTHHVSYNGEPITTEYYSTTGELSIGAEVYCRKESNYEILPQETQDVLNKIQTFYPNSTIQTNDSIELNLKYIADTKNYIDGIEEQHNADVKALREAIVALGGKL